jgi:hypothetical protein
MDRVVKKKNYKKTACRYFFSFATVPTISCWPQRVPYWFYNLLISHGKPYEYAVYTSLCTVFVEPLCEIINMVLRDNARYERVINASFSCDSAGRTPLRPCKTQQHRLRLCYYNVLNVQITPSSSFYFALSQLPSPPHPEKKNRWNRNVIHIIRTRA